MRIVCYLELFVPKHNAGAEVMIYEMMLEMVKKGHRVTVVTSDAVRGFCPFIDCVNTADEMRVREIIKGSDIIITQLRATQRAVYYAKRFRKPLVNIIHNDKQIERFGITNKSVNLLVANSQWIYDGIDLEVEKIIVYPPIDVEKYAVETNGEAIVLINLIKAKGGELFYKLAELMPDYKFIGVKGGYLVKSQIVPSVLPDNVEIVENTPDILGVYKRAKIVLMPSEAESWGRVPIEACCSCIPVIANKTSGLSESLGDAGIFLDVNKPLLWVKTIEGLYKQRALYKKRGELCKKRALEIESCYKTQINVFEQKMEEIISNGNYIQKRR